jgi:hypothetical protein
LATEKKQKELKPIKRYKKKQTSTQQISECCDSAVLAGNRANQIVKSSFDTASVI